MDARVEALIDELSSAGHLQPAATRERILALFDEVRDEPSRVALLHLFDTAMSITVRHMEAHGQDTGGLRDAVLADKRLFAIREATPGGANVDPAMLAHVVAREIAAGRMDRDSFGELAQAGATAPGNTGGAEHPGASVLGRIFGKGC
jgi:hypothetical protein